MPIHGSASSWKSTATGRTRAFPVFDEDEDDVVGVLSVKDAMASLAGGELDLEQPVAKMMRTALFVPETKRLDDLFDMLQQSGHKMALAVDEFGGVAGIITLTRGRRADRREDR